MIPWQVLNEHPPPLHAPRQQRRIEGPVTASATPGPWLPATALPKRLNEDLEARGWKVWHHRDRTVTLTAPDSQTFACEDLRSAYETAREYANTQAWDEVTE